MKSRIIFTTFFSILIFFAQAQHDTLYIMKDGVVIHQQSIKPEDVDSIIFYKPEVAPVTTVTDADGNVYEFVSIGDQMWMAENLKTTKYNDGTEIPLVTGNTEWNQLTTPGYSWYENDKETYGNIYGAIYNWYAVNTEKLCPVGWHVPTQDEWLALEAYLATNEGGKLKETGTTHWGSPNSGATNETGFTALPGGKRDFYGEFLDLGQYGYWWSSLPEEFLINMRRLLYNSPALSSGKSNRAYGYSVRCLKDSNP